jgi:hypothetical protein
MNKTRIYKKAYSDKDTELMLREYTGSNDFINSIKQSYLDKGFKKLSPKQKLYVGIALRKETKDISIHYTQLVRSFMH